MFSYPCILMLFYSFWPAEASVQDCTFKDPNSGKLFDFSSLMTPTGYNFNQRVWQIHGFGLDSLVADEQVNLTLHVQVCRNFATPPPGCKDVGALYIINDGKCTCWGDANVATFDPNTFKDGANLKMYHGTQLDDINFNSGVIFFVCNKGLDNRFKAEAPYFEHVKVAMNQAHFKFFTHLAC